MPASASKTSAETFYLGRRRGREQNNPNACGRNEIEWQVFPGEEFLIVLVLRQQQSKGFELPMAKRLLVSLLIPLATWATITALDYRRVGKSNFEEKPISLLVHATLLLMVGAAAWTSSSSYRTFVCSKGSRWIIGFVGLALMIGILRGNAVPLILLDLKIASWIFGGYALACLLFQSGNVKLLIFVFAASTSLLLILAARGAEVIDDNGRIGGGVYWDYADLSFVFLGVIYTYFAPFTLLRLILFAAVLSIYAYYGVNLGANRSDLIAFSVFGFGVFTAFMCRPRAAGFGRLIYPRIIFVTLLLILIAGLCFSLGHNGTLDFSEVRGIARLEDVGIFNETTTSRWDELVGLFSQSSLPQLIFGRGLGGTILNVTGEQQINYLHIAVFEYLMKLGMIPFVIIVWILYIKIPVRFVRALLGDKSLRESETQAILSAYPFVLGWLALTLMSRGINWYIALGLGVIWAAYDKKIRRSLEG
jgi:hypothetical protein